MLQRHAHCAWATTTIMLIIFVACDACWVCLCCHNPPNSDRDYSIFIVRTNVNACDCTRGCRDTERESALKVDSVRNAPGNRTCVSGVSVRRSKQLSYIPSHVHVNIGAPWFRSLHQPQNADTQSEWGVPREFAHWSNFTVHYYVWHASWAWT